MLIRLAGFLKYAKFAATFMLVISAVSCGGGSSESGSGGGSEDADPTGSYYGTYSGDCSGSWKFTVQYDSRTLTGSTQDCYGAAIAVKGTIDKNWNINFGTAGGDQASFTGKIDSSLKVSGSWDSWDVIKGAIDGTFTGQCSYKSIIDGSPYCAP